MKRFLLLHVGFETPTPEIMNAWKAWFEEVADVTVEHVGLGAAREVTHAGATDLGTGRDAVTGYSIVEAASMQEAERIARSNPFITSIRIHEIRTDEPSGT
jgi:hypothetical protein